MCNVIISIVIIKHLAHEDTYKGETKKGKKDKAEEMTLHFISRGISVTLN